MLSKEHFTAFISTETAATYNLYKLEIMLKISWSGGTKYSRNVTLY